MRPRSAADDVSDRDRVAVRGARYSIGVRIYFVGSHATGKTTLCRYVSRRYGLPMISEVARAVLAEMETGLDALRTDMDLVAEYQERVFQRQVAVEQQHEGRYVSDRAFDNLAYVAEHTTNAFAMMNDQRFRDYMRWVSEGVVFFLRPHQSLLKDDGVRAGVSWDSVLRIDGMVKLMLEQYGVSYLPLESVSMQERVRAVEFVLSRCGLNAMDTRVATKRAPAAVALAPKPRVDSWPYALVDGGDHEA
jgi:nicotinamide riboside kinase